MSVVYDLSTRVDCSLASGASETSSRDMVCLVTIIVNSLSSAIAQEAAVIPVDSGLMSLARHFSVAVHFDKISSVNIRWLTATNYHRGDKLAIVQADSNSSYCSIEDSDPPRRLIPTYILAKMHPSGLIVGSANQIKSEHFQTRRCQYGSFDRQRRMRLTMTGIHRG